MEERGVGRNREMSVHRQFMQQALEQAREGLERGEVPVGGVLVADGEVIARAHNRTGQSGNPGDHAEMLLLREGHRLLGPRLSGASLYVTLEPCAMCAGAIVLARLEALYFGAYDAKAGAAGTLYAITEDRRLNHRLPTYGGLRDEEARELLQIYFRRKRES